MKTNVKRVLSVVITLCLCIAMCTMLIPINVEAKTVITDPYGTSGSSYSATYAAKLDNIFQGNVALFSNTSATFALGQSLNVNTQYSVAGALSGYQCYIYANAVYYYLFGDIPYHGSGLSGYWNDSSTVLANQVSASYSSFRGAGVGFGAYIRTTGNSDGSYSSGTGHSMIVLTYDSSSITYLDCNSNGAGLVRVAIETWDEFNTSHVTGKSRRISHVVQCNSAPLYADLGTDFTAPILNKAAWKPIENSYTESDKPPVRIQTENGKANQLWYFSRQSDGSYMISSCQDGKYLDVRDAGTGTGVVIQTCVASGSDAQKWYLYEKDGGYIIKSKLSGYVLDLVNNDSTSGNTLQTWEDNGTTAQIWAIYRGDECKITGPSLTVSVGDSKSNTKFTWNDIYGESCYYIKIWKGTAWEGNSYLEAACTSTSYSVQLPAGTYQAYVDAAHYYDYEMSNLVTFTVSEHQHSYSYKVSTSPTTSATGKLTGTCSKCSGTTTVTLPKLSITDYTYKVVTAATCTANGTGRYTWKTTTYGNFCFDVAITKTGHSYHSVVTAPTCTELGYTTHACSCGDSYVTDEVAALGHSFTNYISNGDATCTEDGTKTAKCDRCDATDTVVEEGSATGHSYTSEVTNEPTCEDKGIKTFTCTCGDSYTEEIPPTGEHEYEDGYCKHCGERETAYIPGDINGDGNVNARDVTKLLQYLADWDVEVVEAALDVNDDGKVNVRDVTLLKQYIAGWDVELF